MNKYKSIKVWGQSVFKFNKKLFVRWYFRCNVLFFESNFGRKIWFVLVYSYLIVLWKYKRFRQNLYWLTVFSINDSCILYISGKDEIIWIADRGVARVVFMWTAKTRQGVWGPPWDLDGCRVKHWWRVQEVKPPEANGF